MHRSADMSRNLILLLLFAATTALAGLSKLDALRMIESGDNDSAVGCAGEVSRFQIRPEIWRLYSASRSFSNPQISALVAHQHLRSLEAIFRSRAGRDPTDFDLYVLWNAGAGYYGRIGFAPDRVHHRIAERATRYVNLRQMQLASSENRSSRGNEAHSSRLAQRTSEN